jgi:hypothetical protein
LLWNVLDSHVSAERGFENYRRRAHRSCTEPHRGCKKEKLCGGSTEELVKELAEKNYEGEVLKSAQVEALLNDAAAT